MGDDPFAAWGRAASIDSCDEDDVNAWGCYVVDRCDSAPGDEADQTCPHAASSRELGGGVLGTPGSAEGSAEIPSTVAAEQSLTAEQLMGILSGFQDSIRSCRGGETGAVSSSSRAGLNPPSAGTPSTALPAAPDTSDPSSAPTPSTSSVARGPSGAEEVGGVETQHAMVPVPPPGALALAVAAPAAGDQEEVILSTCVRSGQRLGKQND